MEQNTIQCNHQKHEEAIRIDAVRDLRNFGGIEYYPLKKSLFSIHKYLNTEYSC